MAPTTIILILFASLSAIYLVYAIWIWRMPEKKWNDFSSDRAYISDLFHNYQTKYNPKKVRYFSIAYLLFEAVGLFLVGLIAWEHPVLAQSLAIGLVGASVVYGFVVLVFCKERKYRKK